LFVLYKVGVLNSLDFYSKLLSTKENYHNISCGSS